MQKWRHAGAEAPSRVIITNTRSPWRALAHRDRRHADGSKCNAHAVLARICVVHRTQGSHAVPAAAVNGGDFADMLTSATPLLRGHRYVL